jgi:hypothetical protein
MLALVIEMAWEFVAHRGSQDEFARVYGEQGAWALLCASSPHCLGSARARDVPDDRCFLVIAGATSPTSKPGAPIGRPATTRSIEPARRCARARPAWGCFGASAPERAGARGWGEERA